MIDRLLYAPIKDFSKSILLLGPRQVGKSTLVSTLKPDLSINLADEETLLEYSSRPSRIKEILSEKTYRSIAIDEVQRLPSLLNTLQVLIDNDKRLKFYLTGSSARKLKRGGANLLPGRLINFEMGPIVFRELNYRLPIEQALKYGTLPEIVASKNIKLTESLLNSYAANYIKEEIRAEALTKSLDAFSRFFSEISLQNGKFIDYTKISNRAKISRHTCPNYFEILEDTLLGYRVYPDPSLLEKADLIKHPKFFFFDGGVYNGILKSYDLSPERVGLLCEQLVFSQLFHSAHALSLNASIHTFRTRGGLEVDFQLNLEGMQYLIEVKYSDNLNSDDVAPLKEALRYFKKAVPMLVHLGKTEKKINGVWCYPLGRALKEIGL